MNLQKEKVLVAMSGGVDSSVAAWLLKDRGFEVIGASLNLFSCDRAESACCSAADRGDARKVCELIGAKYVVYDYRAQFKKMVIEKFVGEYQSGRTPSPCILCNEHFKFDALLKEAEKLGAKYVATGHYARISLSAPFKLLKGVDESKDQSYFLFTLDQKRLSKLMFPIGHLKKTEVRKIAADAGLPVMDKAESQEVCFVPDNNYASFVESHSSGTLKGPGDFVDTDGRVIGHHNGIHAFTIGQRRGLGFGFGKRQYVVSIDPIANQVVLGDNEDLDTDKMIVGGISWVAGTRPALDDIVVKIRSTHKGVRAKIHDIDGNKVEIEFDKPQRAVAPGQAAVFYDGDEVLGGGWIEKGI